MLNGTGSRPIRACVSLSALGSALLVAGAVSAQTAPPKAPPAGPSAQEAGDIVVTGFRASLNSALADKRSEVAAIDSIKAEDIGKFPDSNLAESMQRVPGVALAR